MLIKFWLKAAADVCITWSYMPQFCIVSAKNNLFNLVQNGFWCKTEHPALNACVVLQHFPIFTGRTLGQRSTFKTKIVQVLWLRRV